MNKNKMLLLKFPSSDVFYPNRHPVFLFLPSYLLASVPHAINLAQFADLSRRNQEGANSSDPIRQHSREQGRKDEGGREGVAIHRRTDGPADGIRV